MDKNNGKQAVWIYAVVLFTSAFIVLLITAYSQIKFNKNINEYRNQLSVEEKEKINYQTNLSSALEENKKVNQEYSSLKEELEKLKLQIEGKDKEIENINSGNKEVLSSYEALISAEEEYDKGNYIQCALLLHSECKIENLKDKGLKRYNFLVDTTYNRASEELYRDGLKEYRQKNYLSSIDNFKLSTELVQTQYFSDDCFFYMGYAYYNEGNYEMAKKSMLTLLGKYTNSDYKEDALQLVEKLGN